MKRRINRIIDVEPMSKYEAEIRLGHKIKNLLHGDSGFLIKDKWFPQDIILPQSVPYETISDRLSFFKNEIDSTISFLLQSGITKEQKKELIKYIQQLLKHLKQ